MAMRAVLSGTQITATSPAGTAEMTAVTVTNPGGQSGSLPSAFTQQARRWHLENRSQRTCRGEWHAAHCDKLQPVARRRSL